MRVVGTFTDAEVLELVEATVFANTPASLLRWLLNQSAAVSRVSRALNEEQLLQASGTLIGEGRLGEPQSIAVLYGLLAAAIQSRLRRGRLGELPPVFQTLDWSRSMWDLASRSRPVSGSLRIDVPTPPPVGLSSSTGAGGVAGSRVDPVLSLEGVTRRIR